MKADTIKIGEIFTSRRSGDFKVISEMYRIKHQRYYDVEFIKTGYITSAMEYNIKVGYVNDPYYPTVCGVGYLGKPRDDKTDRKIYFRWKGMINRCYNPNNERYNIYGGVGVTVCERWHCYANFAEDIKFLPGYQDMIDSPHIKYHLDKDILQHGIPSNQKVYSPETCIFVRAPENALQVNIDHHKNKYYNLIYDKRTQTHIVRIKINNVARDLSRYENDIVAANAANHARRIYGLPILNNNIPYISPEEVNAQNLKKLPEMCTIVKKEMVKIIK